MTTPVKIPCVVCGTVIPETHPTCGDGWDICESCRGEIVDSPCQDIPLYCQCCHQPVGGRDYMGAYTMPGDSTHAPGRFWVFRCQRCKRWSRCHESTEKTLGETMAEVEGQREAKP